jgi:hypothetical protein
MFSKKILPVLGMAALLAFSGSIGAQSSSAPYTKEVIGALLRIQLVISRYAGEKKIGSIPYVFVVAADTSGPAGAARIRMGVDSPIPIAIPGVSGQTVDYKSIGTNIDCNSAIALSGGRYAFIISIQNTAAVADTAVEAKDSSPLFRRFDATFTPVLRDGQSMQTVASADPVTGEVVKIDVTMNVVR